MYRYIQNGIAAFSVRENFYFFLCIITKLLLFPKVLQTLSIRKLTWPELTENSSWLLLWDVRSKNNDIIFANYLVSFSLCLSDCKYRLKLKNINNCYLSHIICQILYRDHYLFSQQLPKINIPILQMRKQLSEKLRVAPDLNPDLLNVKDYALFTLPRNHSC